MVRNSNTLLVSFSSINGRWLLFFWLFWKINEKSYELPTFSKTKVRMKRIHEQNVFQFQFHVCSPKLSETSSQKKNLKCVSPEPSFIDAGVPKVNFHTRSTASAYSFENTCVCIRECRCYFFPGQNALSNGEQTLVFKNMPFFIGKKSSVFLIKSNIAHSQTPVMQFCLSSWYN